MKENEINSEIKLLIESAFRSLGEMDYESAIEELKTAEIMDRDNPEILYNLGIVHAKVGLHKFAVEYYLKVTGLKSSFVDVNNVKKLLSYSSIKLNDMISAEKYILEYLKVYKRDVSAFNMLGYIYEKKKDYDKAIDVYNSVLKLDENNINSYNSLAYLYAITGNSLDKAVEYSRKLLSKNPDNPCYLDTAGYVHFKKGNMDLARKYLKKAYEKMPASEEIKQHLTELLKI